jgi:hypothetical protein
LNKTSLSGLRPFKEHQRNDCAGASEILSLWSAISKSRCSIHSIDGVNPWASRRYS